MQMLVKDLLSQPPVVPARTTVMEALEVLLASGANQVYVIDSHGQLVGAVTDYDLLKIQMGPFLHEEQVENAISRGITSVSPDMPVDEVAPLFREGRHQTMAVAENGRLLGQISRRDVMRLLLSRDIAGSDETAGSSAVETPDASVPLRRPQFIQNRRPTGGHPQAPALSLFAGLPTEGDEPL